LLSKMKKWYNWLSINCLILIEHYSSYFWYPAKKYSFYFLTIITTKLCRKLWCLYVYTWTEVSK
jgi:hypothetical protein